MEQASKASHFISKNFNPRFKFSFVKNSNSLFTYKRFAFILARSLGVCPARIEKNEDQARFSWISICTLQSFIILVMILLFSFNICADYIPLTAKVSTSTTTDFFALSTFLYLYFSFRLLCYIMCVFKTASLVRLYNFVEEYEEQYNMEGKPVLWDTTGCGLLIGFALGIAGNMVVSVELFTDLVETELEKRANLSTWAFYRYPVLHIIPSPTWAICTNAVGHSIGEFSLIFTIATVSYFCRVIMNNMKSFTKCIEGAINETNRSSSKKEGNCPDHHELFEKFIIQYEKLIKISGKLQNYCQDILLMFITFTMTFQIMATYLYIIEFKSNLSHWRNNEGQVYDLFVGTKETFALLMSSGYSVYEISVLVNLGEKLKNVWKTNTQRISFMQPNYDLETKCLDQWRHLQGLVGNNKMELEIHGFFNFNRATAVSMISFEIGLIIILSQYRITDVTKTM